MSGRLAHRLRELPEEGSLAELGLRRETSTPNGLVLCKLDDLSKVEGCDVICIPGGFGTAKAMVDEAFMREIRRLASAAKYQTSVCTGALILGAAGLLRGKRAATYWASRDTLQLFGAIVERGRVVRDGNIITGGGVTAGMDFALAAIAEIFGQAVAEGRATRIGVRTGAAIRDGPSRRCARRDHCATAQVHACRSDS